MLWSFKKVKNKFIVMKVREVRNEGSLGWIR